MKVSMSMSMSMRLLVRALVPVSLERLYPRYGCALVINSLQNEDWNQLNSRPLKFSNSCLYRCNDAKDSY